LCSDYRTFASAPRGIWHICSEQAQRQARGISWHASI
jgi:hypothetical protein